MTTYIQIGTIAYDNIEDPNELEILESFEGEKEMADFVWIVEGDESLIKATSLNPLYGERFTADELYTMLNGDEHDDISCIIVATDIDGLSDHLEELGFERIKSYWNDTLTYNRR